jgi:hypothetical protein
VALDVDFAALADVENYHVFVTAEGESSGLYVSARTPTTFEVREQANGSSTLQFSYRIVARRADVEHERLAVMELPSRSTHLTDRPGKQQLGLGGRPQSN